MHNLLIGQWISALIAGTGIFSSLLTNLHANFPIFLCFINYTLLSFFVLRKSVVSQFCPNAYTDSERKVTMFEMFTRTIDDDNVTPTIGPRSTNTHEETPPLAAVEGVAMMNRCAKLSKLLFGRYVCAALIDVYGNFFIILAYNYTTITSIMLLDCFTIPVAMALSYLFLGCQYNAYHMLGVSMCLLGLVFIVISDSYTYEDRDHFQGENPLLGDMLCLLGAGLYGASNVLQEYMVKYNDRDEYMGMLGCCGAVISFVQLLSTDYAKMRRTNYTTSTYLYTAGFVTCLFLIYTNTSAFLQQADSTLFNLSLLTSDIYAVIFSYFFYGYLVHWMYFVAFTLVAMGLVIYHSTTPPIPPSDHDINTIPRHGLRQEGLGQGLADQRGLGQSTLPTTNNEDHTINNIEERNDGNLFHRKDEKRDGRRIGLRAGAAAGLGIGLESLVKSTYNPLRSEEETIETTNEGQDEDGCLSSSSSSSSSTS